MAVHLGLLLPSSPTTSSVSSSSRPLRRSARLCPSSPPSAPPTTPAVTVHVNTHNGIAASVASRKRSRSRQPNAPVPPAPSLPATSRRAAALNRPRKRRKIEHPPTHRKEKGKTRVTARPGPLEPAPAPSSPSKKVKPKRIYAPPTHRIRTRSVDLRERAQAAAQAQTPVAPSAIPEPRLNPILPTSHPPPPAHVHSPLSPLAGSPPSSPPMTSRHIAPPIDAVDLGPLPPLLLPKMAQSQSSTGSTSNGSPPSSPISKDDGHNSSSFLPAPTPPSPFASLGGDGADGSNQSGGNGSAAPSSSEYALLPSESELGFGFQGQDGYASFPREGEYSALGVSMDIAPFSGSTPGEMSFDGSTGSGSAAGSPIQPPSLVPMPSSPTSLQLPLQSQQLPSLSLSHQQQQPPPPPPMRQARLFQFPEPQALEYPPRFEKDAKLWKTACRWRVWEIAKRYSPDTIRSVVAQEAHDYYSSHGYPPGYWGSSSGSHFGRGKSKYSFGRYLGKRKRRRRVVKEGARKLSPIGEAGQKDSGSSTMDIDAHTGSTSPTGEPEFTENEFMTERIYHFELDDDDDMIDGDCSNHDHDHDDEWETEEDDEDWDDEYEDDDYDDDEDDDEDEDDEDDYDYERWKRQSASLSREASPASASASPDSPPPHHHPTSPRARSRSTTPSSPSHVDQVDGSRDGVDDPSFNAELSVGAVSPPSSSMTSFPVETTSSPPASPSAPAASSGLELPLESSSGSSTPTSPSVGGMISSFCVPSWEVPSGSPEVFIGSGRRGASPSREDAVLNTESHSSPVAQPPDSPPPSSPEAMATDPLQAHVVQHTPPQTIMLSYSSPILPLPPPRLDTVRVYQLRAAELGVKLTGRGTPADRARAAEWGRRFREPCKKLGEEDEKRGLKRGREGEGEDLIKLQNGVIEIARKRRKSGQYASDAASDEWHTLLASFDKDDGMREDTSSTSSVGPGEPSSSSHDMNLERPSAPIPSTSNDMSYSSLDSSLTSSPDSPGSQYEAINLGMSLPLSIPVQGMGMTMSMSMSMSMPEMSMAGMMGEVMSLGSDSVQGIGGMSHDGSMGMAMPMMFGQDEQGRNTCGQQSSAAHTPGEGMFGGFGIQWYEGVSSTNDGSHHHHPHHHHHSHHGQSLAMGSESVPLMGSVPMGDGQASGVNGMSHPHSHPQMELGTSALSFALG